MNKFNAFWFSGLIVLVGLLISYMLGAEKYMDKHGMTAHMIFWYMLWKQFHDKRKDE